MSVGLSAIAFIGVLLQTEPTVDPNVAKPGWIALVVTVALLVALTLLFFSMRKQMRKIQIPRDSDVDVAEQSEPAEQSERSERSEQQERSGQTERPERPEPR